MFCVSCLSVCLSVVCYLWFNVLWALLPEIKDSILFYSVNVIGGEGLTALWRIELRDLSFMRIDPVFHAEALN